MAPALVLWSVDRYCSNSSVLAVVKLAAGNWDMIDRRTLWIILLCAGVAILPMVANVSGGSIATAEEDRLRTDAGGASQPAGSSPGSNRAIPNLELSDTAYGQIGDANGSQSIDIDDVTYLIAYIFSQGPAPVRLCTADVDDSGRTDIDDVVHLIMYVLSGGPPPVALGSVIPRPVHCLCSDEDYELTEADTIWIESEFDDAPAVGQYLADKLGPSTGFSIRVQPADHPIQKGIVLRTDEGKASLGEEGYELTTTSSHVVLEAYRPEGLFRGIQTIRQLLPDEVEDSAVHEGPWTIQGGYVLDYPNFKWRGLLFDVVRHYFGAETVKEYIDLLAYYKMNVFHWHLTDDQGWRPEIESHPLFNDVGSWRGDDNYGGYYTKVDMTSVVAYAAARYIDVIPEIEMPGHSTAAIVSYPHLMCHPIEDSLCIPENGGVYNTILCAGQDSTLDVIKAVLDEIVDVFPSSVIHIGGDEVPKDRWETCPYCQARIAALDLADEEELQEWFMKEISWYLYDNHGRSAMGWSEGGVCQAGMPPGIHAQWWMPGSDISTLAENGYDIVNTNYYKLYLDQWHCTLTNIYNYDITNDTDSASVHHVLGAEAALWTESIETDAQLADKILPRIIAVAENTWTPFEAKNYGEFRMRLLTNLRCLDFMGIDYGAMEE